MVSVLVDKDRFRAGSLAISQLNSQVLILDDGFQHLPLKRDLDIVLVDAAEPFGHGHLFPRGLLREPLKALARADLVLIVAARGNDQERLEEIKKTLAEYNPRAPIFMGERRPLFWVELPAGTRRELEEMKEKRCAAFCGIANPSSFLSLLSALGVEVVKSSSFPDHHSYSRTELSDIAGWAQQAKAQALLTTEKDAVRLPADSFPISMPLLYLRIEIRLQGEEEFFSRLHQGCGR
jgi:tetraacyldisaccharide 4'-kinase